MLSTSNITRPPARRLIGGMLVRTAVALAGGADVPGALEWESQEVIEKIKDLMSKGT